MALSTKGGAVALFLVVQTALCLAAGCSGRAKRPPSPAKDIRIEDLERQSAPPGERYYVLIFGSQAKPLRPRDTHSWASTVRVVDQGPGQAPLLEELSISWMPASLEIHPWRFRVEP
jgi:hypothetical protein